MNLNNRVENLEKKHPIGGGKEPVWRIMQPAEIELTDADIETAKEAYRAKHPDWQLHELITLPVGYSADSPVMQMIEKMESGEWPPKA